MLQGIEDHLEGTALLGGDGKRLRLSQRKSQDESLRDENKLVELGVETMR